MSVCYRKAKARPRERVAAARVILSAVRLVRDVGELRRELTSAGVAGAAAGRADLTRGDGGVGPGA